MAWVWVGGWLVIAVLAGVGGQSCLRNDLTFTRFPVDGVNGRSYFVNNYLDLDPTAGLRDYLWRTGAVARTYNGHRGVDIGIANFRRMDDGSAVIRAAAPGTVIQVVENNPDRNSIWCPSLPPGTPAPQWNVVTIRHSNGWRSIYGHLKRNSATVAVNQVVAAGQVIGVMGSSGCSTDPHLHFEVRDCSNNAQETFSPNMWSSPVAYTPISNIMDLMLKRGQFSGSNELRDPPPDVRYLDPSDVLGIGVVAVYRNGDIMNIRVIRPNGSLRWSTDYNFPGSNARNRRGRFRWWVALTNHVGWWRVEVRMNGILRRVKWVGVTTISQGLHEVVRLRVSTGAVGTTMLDAITAGYRPVLIDGYNNGLFGGAYISIVFRPNEPFTITKHSLTSSEYQSQFDNRPSGYRPTYVESYRDGFNVRYALIMKKQGGGAWSAFHGRSVPVYNALFNNLRNAGYSPMQISVVSVGGQRYYTGLWEKRNIGSWYVRSTVRVSDYQALFDQQRNQGRRPMYLNGYRHNGVDYLSCIFASGGPISNNYEARHGMTLVFALGRIAVNVAAGRDTTALTGYNNDRFAAAWYK